MGAQDAISHYLAQGFKLVVSAGNCGDGSGMGTGVGGMWRRRMGKFDSWLQRAADGAGYHRSQLVKDWAEVVNIRLHYLPLTVQKPESDRTNVEINERTCPE